MAECREFLDIVTVSNSNADVGAVSATSELKTDNEMMTGSSQLTSKKRVPRRILHFSDGDLEEFSTDDEEEEEFKKLNEVDSRNLVDPRQLTWAPFIWYQFKKVGNKTLSVCDYLGEHFADFFGITSPKYQYEIEEYFRMKAEEENERKKNMEMSSWSDRGAVGGDKDSAAIDEQPNIHEDKERY